MNKKMKTSFSAIIIAVLLISCDKDNGDNLIKSNESSIIAEFPFDDDSELTDWQFAYSDNAQMIIDKNDKKIGKGSLKIYNQCTSLVREKGINVTPGKKYKISFFAKSQDFLENEDRCCYAYNYALVVKQGNNDEWYSIWIDNDVWYEKIIYFSSDNTGLPIQLRILMGQKAAWIDDLKIEEL